MSDLEDYFDEDEDEFEYWDEDQVGGVVSGPCMNPVCRVLFLPPWIVRWSLALARVRVLTGRR